MKRRNVIYKLALSVLVLTALFSFSSVRTSTPVQTQAWSGTQYSNEGTYYSTVGSETGSALVSKLNTITGNPTPLTSYDWSRYEAADEAEGQSNKVLLIYSRQIVLKTAHVSGSTGWNREHTYPDSKIGSPANADNHHIFADDNQTNNKRGSKLFGEVPQTSANRVTDGYGNLTDCYTTNTHFYPNEPARGEVARATMYLNIRYGYSVEGNFESIATMLRWHLENPVSNREIYRNNTIHTLQKNRNPFIDHPEYACRIWGATNGETQTLCAGSSQVDVTSVSLSPASGSINLLDSNKTLQLTANVLPTNATDKSVTWSSSNTGVATVSSAGLVTGVSAGSATITVTTEDGNKQDTASVTVTDTPAPSATTTYTFTSKTWTADIANWQSVGDANSFESARGIQVYSSTVAAGNSPYFENIVKVTFGIATSSKGVGSFKAFVVPSANSAAESGTQIGSDVAVNKSPTTTEAREFIPSTPLSGYVQAVLDVTTSSLYLKYVTIEVEATPNYQNDADLWASNFLNTTSTGCTAQSFTTLNSVWPTLSSEYSALAVEVKAIIENSTPNVAGNEVEQALARYVFIVNKYGLQAFITGIVTSVHNTSHNEKTPAGALLILLSIATLSVLPFAYKRKKRILN